VETTNDHPCPFFGLIKNQEIIQVNPNLNIIPLFLKKTSNGLKIILKDQGADESPKQRKKNWNNAPFYKN
jgi:hypothetical protein